MEVVGFQVIVIVSVALLFLVGGEKKALYLSIFWTLWTVVLLFYPPLIITQLGFTWGTFFVCKNIVGSRRKIKELRSALSAYPVPMQNRIEDQAKGSTINKVIGDAHRTELHKAVRTVSNSLVILSGWITSSIVNDRFVRELEDAISRGAKIFVGYGWEDSSGSHIESSSSTDAIARLKALKRRHPEDVHVTKFANHQKILIKDSEYIICGSNNWLSNNAFRNSEMSMKIYSQHLAESEADRIKREVKQGSGLNEMGWRPSRESL